MELVAIIAISGISILLFLFWSLDFDSPLWISWPFSSKRRRMNEGIKKIPGPFSLPIFGNSFLLAFKSKADFFQIIDEVKRQYWPMYVGWYGPVPEVNYMEAEHIETLLPSSVNIKKGFIYQFLEPWLGTGLLTSKGEKWHRHRKLITPSFHFKMLENFQDVFTEKSQILVEKLAKKVGEGFDVCPYISRCTLDIICETAMGTTVNAQEDTHSPYVQAIYDLSEILLDRLFAPWMYPDFIFCLTKNGRKMKECLRILHSFSNEVIHERKDNFKKNVESFEECEVPGRKKRMAFLDMLLEAARDGAVLTHDDIREEVDTFMFEGHDTTSTSLSWTLFLLGNHPDVQARVFEEQEAIFGNSDRLPNIQDLAEMKYLERVIKESLRLYPSVPFISRSLIEDIEIGGHSLREGCQVVINIYHAHRNPKYFPDPENFDPDNFLPARVQGRHPYAFVPFSAGPRNCIGQRFALQEEKTVLSAIVRHFHIRALDKPSEVKLTGELILRSANGIRLTLQPR